MFKIGPCEISQWFEKNLVYLKFTSLNHCVLEKTLKILSVCVHFVAICLCLHICNCACVQKWVCVNVPACVLAFMSTCERAVVSVPAPCMYIVCYYVMEIWYATFVKSWNCLTTWPLHIPLVFILHQPEVTGNINSSPHNVHWIMLHISGFESPTNVT